MSSSSTISTSYRVKVITDIDDCVKSSGGVKLFGIALGGIDKQYDRGQFYPGTFQFSFELSRQHAFDSSQSPSGIQGNDSIESVAVLTARAREFKFALAIKPTDKLCEGYRRTGLKYGYPSWGIGHDDVFYGSVVEWILQYRKGLRKSLNFDILLSNDRRRVEERTPLSQLKYIFIGDTGDRDEDAAIRMIDNHGSTVLQAIFLHLVSSNPYGVQAPLPADRVYQGVPIYYFRTYVHAGWKAYQHDLITREALQCIINESLQDLDYEHQLSTSSSSSLSTSLCSCCTTTRGARNNLTQLRVESRWNDIQRDINLIEKECPLSETSLRQTLITAENKLSSSASAHLSRNSLAGSHVDTDTEPTLVIET